MRQPDHPFTRGRLCVKVNNYEERVYALYGDRFVLGLGVSHNAMVEGLRGHRYDKPLAAISAYLDGINKFVTVLPNYRNSWLGQGFTEAELADGGSDRFIDAMVLWATRTRSGAACGRTSRPRYACLSAAHPRAWRFRRPRPHAGGARR